VKVGGRISISRVYIKQQGRFLRRERDTDKRGGEGREPVPFKERLDGFVGEKASSSPDNVDNSPFAFPNSHQFQWEGCLLPSPLLLVAIREGREKSQKE
jgi:hypothetical protein